MENQFFKIDLDDQDKLKIPVTKNSNLSLKKSKIGFFNHFISTFKFLLFKALNELKII